MIFRVAGDGALRLEGAAEFRSFFIAAAPVADVGAALRGIARMDGAEHAWFTPETVRRLAGPAVDAGWELGFAAMAAYAATKGWTDETGAIRAHVERG